MFKSFGASASAFGGGWPGTASGVAPAAASGASGASLSGQPKPVMAVGSTPATSADANPPPVTTGTSTPAYSVFCERDPSWPSTILKYQSMTAAPAYNHASLEELRMQAYQRRCKPVTSGTFFEGSRQRRPAMSDPSKLELLEELARQCLLGEEPATTEFHLFSGKSASSGQVMKPRVLRGNNPFLAKGSKYFLDLLSSDTNPSDPSLIDVTGDNDIPSNAPIDDYGYESDSDLDDCDDNIDPVTNHEAPKDQSDASPPKASAELQSKDSNELSEDAFESLSSDMFNSTLSLGQSGTDGSFSENKDAARSVTSSETASEEAVDNKRKGKHPAMRLRSRGGRHVLVKDTAFQTWYTLLNYLYTGKIGFLPLSSLAPGGQRGSSTSSLDGPKCSAKSMYRLTCKVGLDLLRDEALAHIRSNLTEDNILQELSCSLVSRYPQLLEMELDMLYSYIDSPPVVANFAAFAESIVHKELPHGVDIIVGIHTRLLKAHHSFSLKPVSTFPKSAKADKSTSNVPEAGVKGKTRPCRGTQSGSGAREYTPGVPPQTSANVAVPPTTSTQEPDAEWKEKATEKCK
ncbi:hypothetical protein OG21DRAFT_1509305 [Imleria badia]|nr:hypothetical protein OG21DRAFT_1509305 [Imleria badia]